MRYISTRSALAPVLFSEALLRGLAPDGGLYVPVALPKIDLVHPQWLHWTYQEQCYHILKPFMPEIDGIKLMDAISSAYDCKFDHPKIAPLVKLEDNTYVLELFRGRTQAFKDMALSLLPHLMRLSAAVTETEHLNRIVLTATSGDTGKAALEAFADIPGVEVVVFYPTDGVSAMQKQQMATQRGENVHVYAIEGNFDDAQRAVKDLMSDGLLAEEMIQNGQRFASANSVNIGRLLPQVVYYVSAYYDLVASGAIELGEPINIVVPTGNFGNLLAAYYAKEMGLPLGQLILAANQNAVLHDFVTTGIYNANRPFYVTQAPSMDILVSSNLERLLFMESSGDWAAVKEAMDALKSKGAFTWPIKEGLLFSGVASDSQSKSAIEHHYKTTGYILDPHTAVGVSVLDAYRLTTGDAKLTIVAGTASPFKFPSAVLEALNTLALSSEAESLAHIATLWGQPVPAALQEALELPIKHSAVLRRDEMKSEVVSIMRGQKS